MNSFQSLEAIIERGKLAYIEVGEALRTIQEGKLYRDHGYATFEDYCKKRWGFSRSVGYDYISASKAAGNVESVGMSLQKPSYSQAVVLSQLDPEQQRQIARETDFASTTVRDLSQKIGTSSSTVEWYTPERYIEAARKVLGRFDLDPASCELANKVVQAGTFFDKEKDGLQQSWRGKVWMNPPYDIGGDFVSKLLREYEAGNVTEAILLLSSSSTATKWFKPLFDHVLCFTDHRVKFYTPHGTGDIPKNGSVFVYLGKNVALFTEQFRQFGSVVRTVPLALPLRVAA